MKNKIFLPLILSLGVLVAACGEQQPSQNLDLIAAQQLAAQRAANPNTVTVTQQNTVTKATTATATVSMTVTNNSTSTVTVRE